MRQRIKTRHTQCVPGIPYQPLHDRNKVDEFRDFLQSLGWTGKRGLKNPLYASETLTLEAVRKYRDIFGELPTSPRLEREGFCALNHAICRHGGYKKLKESLGIKETVRPKKEAVGDVKAHLVEVVRGLTEELGHFPKKSELQERKLWYVFEWAREEFGGMAGLRRAAGTTPHKTGVESLRHWDNLKNELLAVKAKIGHEPTWTELQASGREDILSSVRYFDGMKKVRKRLGWKVLKEEKDELHRLAQWPNLEMEMRRIIAENEGRFPSTRYLSKSGQTKILRATGEYGGLVAVAIIMGYKPCRKTKGASLRHWENLRKELLALEEELGYPPSWSDLEKLKRSDILGAVPQHSGMVMVRKKMGWPLLIDKVDGFRTWDDFERYARSVIGLFGTLPSSRAMAAMGYGNFVEAAGDFGGMSIVRARLGLRIFKRPEIRSYRHWRNAREKLAELSSRLGAFPPYQILEQQTGLVPALYKYHGGYRAAKDKFLERTPTKAKTRLSIDEERAALFWRAKNGDTYARARITRMHYRRIRNMARRTDPSGSYRQDLFNEGVIALLEYMEACNSPGQFYGGVQRCVSVALKKSMGDYLSRGAVPDRRLESRISAVRKVRELLRKKLGVEPNDEEIRDILGMAEFEFAETLKAMATPASFEDGVKMPEKHSDTGKPIDEEWLQKRLLEKGKGEMEAAIIVEALCKGKPANEIARRSGLPKSYVRAVIRDSLKNVSRGDRA